MSGHTLFQNGGSFRRPQIVGSEREPVPPRYWNVLALHMAGTPIKAICEETNYAESTIYAILKDERVTTIRQQILKGLDDEVEVLWKDAVDAIRLAIAGGTLQGDQKWAVEQLCRIQGKYKERASGGDTHIHVSAEDVALQIINQAKEPIT